MMDRWVDILKLFDIGEYESRTYAALVMNGASTVKEVRKAAGIPYSREYDVLESLMKRGFVKMQPGRPRVYSAEDPRKILKRECETRVNFVENLLEEIGPIYDSAIKSKSEKEFFWTIEGRKNTEDKLIEMIEGSKSEILIVGEGFVLSKNIDNALKNSIKRGVKVRCWGEFDSKTKARFADAGIEVRSFKHDHSKYVLTDCREVLVSSDDPEKSGVALYTKSTGCTKLYKSYFDHIWEEAV